MGVSRAWHRPRMTTLASPGSQNPISPFSVHWEVSRAPWLLESLVVSNRNDGCGRFRDPYASARRSAGFHIRPSDHLLRRHCSPIRSPEWRLGETGLAAMREDVPARPAHHQCWQPTAL